MGSEIIGGRIHRFGRDQMSWRPSWPSISVKLDDPSFPAPIYATLIEVEGEEGLQLIWSRPNRD